METEGAPNELISICYSWFLIYFQRKNKYVIVKMVGTIIQIMPRSGIGCSLFFVVVAVCLLVRNALGQGIKTRLTIRIGTHWNWVWFVVRFIHLLDEMPGMGWRNCVRRTEIESNAHGRGGRSLLGN